MIGFPHRAIPSHLDENPSLYKVSAKALPRKLAEDKALLLSGIKPNFLVLGFDTEVLFQRKLLGKPANEKSAYKMLLKLNGKKHTVVTGIALARQGILLRSGLESTEVHFARHSNQILLNYSRLKEPLDKAGAYGIQGQGAILVERISGCFYNVMGLPVQLCLDFLKPFYRETIGTR